jgi:ABC-2 type transport system ATP-binding protein
VNAVTELQGVTVHYGRNAALRDVSVAFPGGAVGLLGPNGAGKSTMIKALLGLIVPDAGTMKVLGRDVRTSSLEIRARIGYMPETDSHIPGMNAVSFVAYCGELAGLPRADSMQRAHEVLYYVGLGEARYRTVETYSTGMKQRIKLAQALVHDPDLVLLDEPTNGMDPQGREDMLALVRDIARNRHISLILSSHVMPDVESVCDAVVVMNHGKVVMQGPIDALKKPAGRLFEVRIKGDRAAFVERLRALSLECGEGDADVLRVTLPVDADAGQLFKSAALSGAQVRHLKMSVPTLEDVFADAVGEQECRFIENATAGVKTASTCRDALGW